MANVNRTPVTLDDGEEGEEMEYGQEQVAGDVEATAEAAAPASTRELSPEELLMARFRLHKKHRREKDAALRKVHLQAASRVSTHRPKGDISATSPVIKPYQKVEAVRALLPPSSTDLARVDHNNRPHRWKDAYVILAEQEARDFQRRLRRAPPVRPYPGKLRRPLYSVMVGDNESTRRSSETSRGLDVVNAEAVGAGSDDHDAHGSSSPSTASSVRDKDEFLKIDQSQFPLHLFDSDEYEPRPLDEWLADGPMMGFSPYYLRGEWRWRPCVVRALDADARKFLIQFQGSDKQKWVRRVNLRFESESAAGFQARIDAATRRREEAKAQLRFDYLLSKQVGGSLRAMSRQTLEHIHVRVVNGLADSVALADGQPAAALLRSLTDAVLTDYTRSMKKAALLDRLRYDEALQEQYMAMILTPVATGADKFVPELGKVAVPEHAFRAHRSKLSRAHYSSSAPLLAVLFRMYAGWEKTFRKLLFVQVDEADLGGDGSDESAGTPATATASSTSNGTTGAATPATLVSQMPFRLLDFQALQTNHQNMAAEILQVDWRRGIVESVIDHLQDHFDLFVSDRASYESGKLKHVLTGIELRMAAQLRHTIARSTCAWSHFVRSATRRDAPPTRAPRNSLFDVQLVLSDDAKDSAKVNVSPDAREITAVMLEPLEAIASGVHELDAIDADVLSLLALERRRLLGMDVKGGNRDAQDARAVIAECLDALSTTKQGVRAMVSQALEAAEELARAFEIHTDFVRFDAAQFLADIAPLDQQDSAAYLSTLTETVRRFHALAQHQIDAIAFDAVPLPLVCVRTGELKKQLKARAASIRDTLLDSLVRDAREQNQRITLQYEAILKRINEKPANEAELAALKAFVNESKSVVAGLETQVARVHSRLDALGEFGHKLPSEDFRLAYATKEWPRRVFHAADSCDSALEEDKVRMMDKLALEKEAFELNLERFSSEVQQFKLYGEIDQTDKYVELAVTLFDSLQEAKERAQDFNAREAVFNFPPTEYALLDKLERDFTPYYKLWTMCAEFAQSRQAWLNGPFLELRGVEIEALVTEWWKASYKLSKTLVEEAPSSAEVALTLRERTDEFRAYLPVIQSLASPALQERHWEAVQQRLGFDEGEEELTLNVLLDRGVAAHLEAIQEIGTVAEKEYSLQKNLMAMIAEWEKIELECQPYRSTGTYLIRITDDIVALLDDHLVKTQTMRGSPYIKSIEKDCRAWEKKLQNAQQLLDEWMQCQRTWLYLEAIFSSEDIMRQMPTEARRFASVDALWRKTMEDAVADPSFMTVAGTDKLLPKFQKANEKLDEIQKGLNDYLEMKRLHFPRFFFLSNDELLEILSQTKEPKAVQPHLGKCFEGVSKVTFTDSMLITEMISAEGEVVPLRVPVNPESTKNKGNVEMWLLEVEQSQWDSVRGHTARAITAYVGALREKWILQWPAQVVLAGSQVYWTQDVTRAINERGCAGLQSYLEELNAQLNTVVVLVRGNLTKLERTTIGALVVIDVHARDTIAQMIAKGVENEQDFEWVSQLRYYWVDGVKTPGTMDL